MSRFVALLLMLGLSAALIAGGPQNPSMCIGIYDSRAVAIAFGNSKEGMEYVKNLHADMIKAMSTKNDSLIQHIETRAKAYQMLSHMRAFSVGSVADILMKHKDEVDMVAKEAGVQIIVSKFELMYADAGIDVVDVTKPLVNLFKPNEQVLSWLSELPKQEPLPLLEVLAMPSEE